MKSILLAILFYLIGFVFYGASTNNIINDRLTELLEKANGLEEKKNFDSAITIYNEALKIASENKLASNASYIYKKIGLVYYRQKKFKNSKIYFKKSVVQDSISKSAADSHFNLALLFKKEKQSDSLLFHLTKSLQIYSELENSEDKYNTYYKAGLLLKNKGDYEEAISYFLKAYQGFDTLKDIKKKARVCNAIGVTQRLLGNLSIAEQYYTEAIRLREELGDSLEISYGYNNLGNLYKEQKKLDSAKALYNRAIVIQNSLNKTNNLGRYYYNLGTVNYLQDDYNEAEDNYKKSIYFKKKEGDSLFLTTPYNELGIIAIKNNQKHKARKYLDSASRTLNPNQSKDVLLRHYEVQSIYYEFVGSFKKALESQKNYTTLYKRLFQQKQASKIQELQEQFESKQKLIQIRELTEGHKIQKGVISNQQKRINTRNWLLLICFVLILLAIVVYFLIEQRHKTKEKSLEIQHLESIFKKQEILKEKISKDLHDIIITSFDAIRLKVLALPKADNPNIVSKSIVNQITDVNKQIRLISHRLSPLGDKIKDTKLTEIIINQLTEFQYYRKVFVDIQLPLPSIINNFTLIAQTNLYGILLEVLTNIEKHSQATEIKITHYKEKDSILLRVQDNGIGFHNKDKNGVGLMNIKQRGKLLKGTCIIDSSEKGTTVSIKFPIAVNLK